MGWLNNIFSRETGVEFYRYEPRVTEYPSFENMIDSYTCDGFGVGGLMTTMDLGHDGSGVVKEVQGMSPARLFATQHQLRQVLTFIARNVAQLGLHSFKRESENDRVRDRKTAFAKTMDLPDDDTTQYELIYELVIDYLLYDRAYWWIIPRFDSKSPYRLRRIPPAWVDEVEKDPWVIDHYLITNGKDKPVKLRPEEVLRFKGYSPQRPGKGSSTIEGLREILAEQLAAHQYRSQVWERGGRVSSVITRPADAPRWSPEARTQFRADWKDYVAGGPMAGGSPVLEDGMELKNMDFSAREQQFVESAALSLSQVAGAFHINPTMVGDTSNTSYSNVREFRRMLYGDSLGPLLVLIEDRINTVLFPMMNMNSAKYYAEFNIEAKLKGSFEEQTTSLQASVGGPWVTRNEARKYQNLPAIEGGDELVTPLNVSSGEQASPQDSGSQNGGGENVNPENAFD